MAVDQVDHRLPGGPVIARDWDRHPRRRPAWKALGQQAFRRDRLECLDHGAAQQLRYLDALRHTALDGVDRRTAGVGIIIPGIDHDEFGPGVVEEVRWQQGNVPLGMERITRSAPATASCTPTALTPIAPANASRLSGPRELAIRTRCPAVANFRARTEPSWPAPMIPIFLCCSRKRGACPPEGGRHTGWWVLVLSQDYLLLATGPGGEERKVQCQFRFQVEIPLDVWCRNVRASRPHLRARRRNRGLARQAARDRHGRTISTADRAAATRGCFRGFARAREREKPRR